MKLLIVLLAAVAVASAGMINARDAMPRSVASNIVDAIEAFRDQMPCGFESMGIPPLAPLNLGHQQVGIHTSDFSVAGEVDDAVIEGLNDFEVDEMKVNMLTSRVTFKMTWKSIQVKSLYDLQAVLKSYGITVEIIGNGNMFMAINDLVISGTIRYSLGLLGGGLSLREFKIVIAIGEVESAIGGLLGNGFVNRKLNEIIEEFIMIAVNDNQAVITSTIEGIGLPLVNNMIGGRTLTDILGSIGGGGGGSSEPTVCIPPTQ